MKRSRKLVAALELLESSNLPRGSHAPPFHRLLWSLGVTVPPPHFCGFSTNALFAGLMCGIVFGALKWCVPWFAQDQSLSSKLAETVFMAGFLGLWMAYNTRAEARGCGIPRWRQFDPGEAASNQPVQTDRSSAGR